MADPKLIVPTAINYLEMLHDGALRGRRGGYQATMTVAPLRQRAWMIVNETTVLSFERETPSVGV